MKSYRVISKTDFALNRNYIDINIVNRSVDVNIKGHFPVYH